MAISQLIVGLVLLIFICGPLNAQSTLQPGTQQASADSKLANTQWRLSSFSVQGAESAVINGTTITSKFGPDGRVGGSSGCNSYGGEYRERGDSLSFSRLISTKRACLEQNANRQEQQFLAALESSSKFKLSDNGLTIFHGDGRSTLNFVNDSASRPAGQRYENLTSPVDLLASFYNAVNAREYDRAYRYWETPPSNLEDFAKGYAETANVQLIVQPPTILEGAAGSLYAEVPTVIVARHQDGGERAFAGCYVTRKSNLDPSDIPKQEVWRIYKASVSPIAAGADIPKLLAQSCR
jgi:heat shock protein HslJ